MSNAKIFTDAATRTRSPRLILQRITLGVLGLWLVVNAVFGWCQEYFLIEPQRLSTGYVRVEKKPSYNRFLSPPNTLLPIAEKEWPEEAIAINFQKYESLEPKRGVLFYLHGNRGSMESCRFEILPFLQAGYDVWTMDYRGFGNSKGVISEVNLLADAQMVYKEILKSEHIDIVWGRSFGSCIATYLAKENSPQRLVLETPYWSITDAARNRAPILMPVFFRYRLPTHEYLEYVKCSVRIIHGTLDEKIYFESSEKLVTHGIKFNSDIVLYPIENGKHNFRPSHDAPSPSIDIAFERALSECLELDPVVP